MSKWTCPNCGGSESPQDTDLVNWAELFRCDDCFMILKEEQRFHADGSSTMTGNLLPAGSEMWSL